MVFNTFYRQRSKQCNTELVDEIHIRISTPLNGLHGIHHKSTKYDLKILLFNPNQQRLHHLSITKQKFLLLKICAILFIYI